MFLGFVSEVYVYCVVAGKVCSANRFVVDVLSLREDTGTRRSGQGRGLYEPSDAII